MWLVRRPGGAGRIAVSRIGGCGMSEAGDPAGEGGHPQGAPTSVTRSSLLSPLSSPWCLPSHTSPASPLRIPLKPTVGAGLVPALRGLSA